MTKEELIVGAKYKIKIGSNWGQGRFEGLEIYRGYTPAGSLKKSRALKRYQFTNIRTGKNILIKSRLKIGALVI